MSRKIAISIILPFYNQAFILPEVLSALHKQTADTSLYEVILVDDGSTDGSKDSILPHLNGKRPRTYYYAQENRGAAAARNLGVRNARGTIVLLLDSDEVAEPNFVQEHLVFHTRYTKETDAALGRLEMAKELMTRMQVRQNETRLRFDSSRISPISWHYFRGGNLSLKKSFFAESGGFDEAMRSASCEDTELGFRLKQSGMQLYYLGGAVAHHYHPMDARMYMSKARAYGRSMARWYVKAPEARSFMTRFYGLPASETSRMRQAKYCAHRLIFNRMTQPLWMACAAATRALTLSFSEVLYGELYKAMYRRTFRHHIQHMTVRGNTCSRGEAEEKTSNEVSMPDMMGILSKKQNQPLRHGLRVVMVNWIYFPEYGGGGLQCRLLVNHLRDSNLSFEILTRTRKAELIGRGEVDGIPVTRILHGNGTLQNRIATAMKLSSQLAAGRDRIDIVHTHGFMPEVNVSAHALGLAVLQKVTSVGLDDGCSVHGRRFGLLAHRIFTMADAIVGTSQAAVDSNVASGVKSDRIWTIPNGVDLGRFKPASPAEKQHLRLKLNLKEGDLYLLFVGFLDPIKGLDLLIDAFLEALPHLPPSAKLLVVGPYDGSRGESEKVFCDTIVRQLRRYGADHRVRFEGVVENIQDYYRSADIFILPSRGEGQPNALLEAMACGLPAVAHNLTGITDQIIKDGKSGRLINCTERNAFAGVLAELSRQPGLRTELGAQARRYIHCHHDIGKIANDYFSLYMKLFDKKSDNQRTNRYRAQ